MLPEIQLNGPVPAIAHLDQYGGVWAVEERHARQMISSINKLNLAAHVSAHQVETAENAKAVDYQQVEADNERIIAVVRVEGVMTKYGSSMSSQGSTLRARRELRHAVNDPRVTGILIKLDSPGGSVSGTPDLAREVAEAAKKKPVYAYCEDLCCSAAYYVASQADKVYANANAIVGSIGVYMVIDDWSKAFEEAGIQPHLVKYGAHKGDGVEGLPITEDMLGRWQEEVDILGEQFVAAVQKGRGLTKAAAQKLADGRVHIGQAAVELKLIDGIQTLDKTLAQLAKAKPAAGAKATADPLLMAIDDDTSEEESPQSAQGSAEEDDSPRSSATSAVSEPQSNSEEREMPKEQSSDNTKTDDTPKAGTYREIVAACKGCDPKNSGDDARFVADCQQRDLTVEQAQGEWMETLCARNEASQKEIAQAKEQAGKSATTAKPPGNAPLEDGDDKSGKSASSAGDPIAEWNAVVKDHMEAGLDKSRAVRRAVAENPELHQAYLAAYRDAQKKGSRPGALR